MFVLVAADQGTSHGGTSNRPRSAKQGCRLVGASDPRGIPDQIRYIRGLARGCEFTSSLRYLLPFYRNLCDRTQQAPVIQTEVIQWLNCAEKRLRVTVRWNCCAQVYRIMARYCKQEAKLVGQVSAGVRVWASAPRADCAVALAGHALVVITCSLTTNFRQVVNDLLLNW
jgi:hypothetical protein